MTIRPSDVIRVAEGELGYHEKASNSKLDDKTANSGNKNYQKYSRDLTKAGYFGYSFQGQAWCAQFVSWVFLTACGGDAKKAMDMQCFSDGKGSAGCGNVYRYYLAEKRVFDTPKVGDQFILYNEAEKTYDHTGLVYTVGNGSFTTIEGNKDNQVKSITRNLHPQGYRYYFCRPTYEEEKTVTITLKELKRGSTGEQVKTVQRILRSRGWKDGEGNKLKIDGDLGAKTETAVKKFQTAKSLKPDGVVGKKTWDKLLGVT